MLQSSESIAALAAALARAQLELTNPEKSLTATLPATSPREEARSYRYASLATGLDIVRKSLGRQEIAAVQSTVIDQQTGLVRLMTVLAHSSGEWLSSEWPVCPITETANPQRVGAALTYARRYALFTLVGIAGEDDLDAPKASRPIGASAIGRNSAIEAASPSARRDPASSRSPSGGPQPPSQPGDQILSPDDSREMREALLSELALIQSTDGLTRWAYRRLRVKNILQDGDARAVEGAFQAKIDAASQSTSAAPDQLDGSAEAGNTPTPAAPTEEPRAPAQAAASAKSMPSRATERKAGRARPARKGHEQQADQLGLDVGGSGSAAESRSANDLPLKERDSSEPEASALVGAVVGQTESVPTSAAHTAVDKSVLRLDEPKRIRDKGHLRYVASQPCLLCSTQPSDAHHIRFAQPRALGRKVSDEYAVPLCRRHHRDVHDSGNEAAWWHDIGIDPIEIAHQLWHETGAQRLPPTGRD